MMSFLRPRIGKINMQGGHRCRRQQVTQKIGRLDPDPSQIGQLRSATFFIKLGDTTQETFDADKIFPRMTPRVLDQERSVAAAQFHLERLRFRKQFRQRERLNDGMQLDDEVLQSAADYGWQRRQWQVDGIKSPIRNPKS